MSSVGKQNSEQNSRAEVRASKDEEKEPNFNEDGGDCGLFCWKPTFLQSFRTAKSYLFWLCWAGGIQSLLINGFVNVFVSSVEKRFELTSTDSGMIVGAYDIASFVFVLPISYLGGRKGICKPRWIGFGVIFLGIGSFLYAVPHFAAGLYQASDEKAMTTMCPMSLSYLNETCHDDSSSLPKTNSLQNFKYVFIMAQLIMGLGAAPLYTLGLTFIDDNVSNKMQPLYSGIFYACTTLGPALGYIGGGQLLRIYVDFLVISYQEAGVLPGSNVWVGAWWLGFLMTGLTLIIVALPLLAFPSELPGFQALSAEKEAQSEAMSKADASGIVDDEEEVKQSSIQSLKELPNAIKDLLTNLPFIFICLEESCQSMILSGFGAFLPKIIESQFSVSSTMSAMIVGALVIPCGCGGSFLGGYLIKRFKMRCANILKLSMLIISGSFLFSLAFIVDCPDPLFAGVNTQYGTRQSLSNIQINAEPMQPTHLQSECNMDCNCVRDAYSPICGIDNVVYFSPCHAGCTASWGSGASKVYSNCSCIAMEQEMHVINGKEVPMMASHKKCSTSCQNLYGFVAMLFLTLAFTFMNTIPALSGTLRCVPSDRRTFALGAQMVIWRLLGSIPGPVIFGAFIDNACVLWQNTCGADGSCLVYDNYKFSRAMLGLAMIGNGMTLCFATLAWWFYKPPSNPEGESISCQTLSRPAASSTEIMAYDNPCVDPA